MEHLNPRKEKVLSGVVRSYVEEATPVGSAMLVRRFRLSVSPATIRSEMCGLEELGYLRHPHTSAGRIPTDKGYRYFVDHMARSETLHPKWLSLLKETYRERLRNTEELIERTLHILSTLSHNTSFVFMPEEESFILKNVTLVPLEGNRVLALWVSTAGFTRSCLIDMGEKLPSEELERLYQFLNKELRGLSYSEIKCHAAQKLQASRDSLRSLYQKACQVIENSLLDSPPEKIFMEGSSKMLEQPEFQRLEEIRPILTGLEEKKVIQGLMRETLQAEALTVRIGSETGNDLFRECSLISIPYYHGSHVMGALGILGPKRMRYGEVMALVTQVSRWVAEGFERWFE